MMKMNFAYNGDGTRVKRQVAGIGTTYYVGNHYEIYKTSGRVLQTRQTYYQYRAKRDADGNKRLTHSR